MRLLLRAPRLHCSIVCRPKEMSNITQPIPRRLCYVSWAVRISGCALGFRPARSVCSSTSSIILSLVALPCSGSKIPTSAFPVLFVVVLPSMTKGFRVKSWHVICRSALAPRRTVQWPCAHSTGKFAFRMSGFGVEFTRHKARGLEFDLLSRRS
jgi:hypothetical protein